MKTEKPESQIEKLKIKETYGTHEDDVV